MAMWRMPRTNPNSGNTGSQTIGQKSPPHEPYGGALAEIPTKDQRPISGTRQPRTGGGGAQPRNNHGCGTQGDDMPCDEWWCNLPLPHRATRPLTPGHSARHGRKH